ncbi:MAG: CAP domain-containing protein [Mucilaginibacter sp.]
MRKIALFLSIAVLQSLTFKAYSQQKAGDDFKQEFLDNINNTRAKGCKCGTTYMRPAPPLTWNDVLESAALAHARDMGEHNYFSHSSRDGRSSGDRILDAGYSYKGFKSYTVGENIAFGQEDIAEVMRGWFKSEGHCKNLMNPDFKEIGIAEYDKYWVQDFGGRVPFSAEQQRLIKSGRIKILQRPLTSY